MDMLASFLSDKRSRLIRQIKNGIKQTDEKFNFILGNESCDHDSALTALIYAWFCSEISDKPGQTHLIPVLNTKEDMFRIKTETVHQLQKHGVGKSDLIFRDTIDFEALCAEKPTSVTVTIVDHHVLSRSDECFSPFVKEIIDHRVQTKTFDESQIFVEIAPVGSCMTLIAEKVLHAIDSGRLVLTQAEMSELSLLMSGPILLDTVNLATSAGKVTPRDRDVINKLWKNEHDPDISMLFNDLSDAKYFVEGLSSMDLLLKDLKMIQSTDAKTKVIFSTMHARLGIFFRDSSSNETVRMLLEDENADLWVALFPMEKDHAGKLFKPVVMYSNRPGLRNQVQQTLQIAESPHLDLDAAEKSIYGKNFLNLRMYNIKASRKQILPIVQEYIR